MKKINFIKTIEPQQQHNLRVWFTISFIACIACIVCLLGISSLQWMLLQSIKQEKTTIMNKLSPLQTYLVKNKTLLDEEQLIREQLKHIERYTKQPKSPLDNLVCINQACGTSPIQTVEINKQQLTITLVCTHAHDALSMIEKLSSTKKFKNLALVDLHTTQQQTQKQTLCTIKGTINLVT